MSNWLSLLPAPGPLVGGRDFLLRPPPLRKNLFLTETSLLRSFYRDLFPVKAPLVCKSLAEAVRGSPVCRGRAGPPAGASPQEAPRHFRPTWLRETAR